MSTAAPSPHPRQPIPTADTWADCLLADRPALKRLARDLARASGARRQTLQAQYAARRARSAALLAERVARLPRPSFDETLPINQRRAEIADLIRAHPVVIVCGETGSGKTTQLPKLCLELGRGAAGLIGHTQPRRLAARAVASRLAQELQTSVGDGVGVKVRFHDNTRPQAWVKLMTDGILLAETQGDRFLNQYDTIIIDEAHERSLNIDFLLGYLKQLLPKRPDLKLIVTSATIDAARFSSHFGDAPVIEVSGRLYPVEQRYRPVNVPDDDDEERDLFDAIVDAVDEVGRAGPGDVLAFLPGEREIREAAEALRKHNFRGAATPTEILPLFARLSADEQRRVFAPHQGRRVVLATNVAETSLTVPGIRYVIDTGLARVKRYSYRNKVEQLRVEPISQASANQRAGRCGRVAAGICIRLYAEDDYTRRPPFADPEILRSSLAGVILRMKGLGLGKVEDFPFLERPQPKAIADGYQLLQELGALDEQHDLTPVGQELSRLPIDPRVARMIVAARDEGCLREVLVIASALSVQDPRERPQERQQAADQAHARFLGKDETGPKSEFVAWVRLWDWYREQLQHKKSQKKLAEELRARFLSPLRMREWKELHGQLAAMVGELGWRENELAAADPAIHRALLSGLLGNLGCRQEETGQYLGARGIKFLIHPASPLQKKAGKWIMAAELTETTRLYARTVARIEPAWIEAAGGHLLRRSLFEPHWEKKAMAAIAFERITLYGLVIDPRRRVQYGPVNPAEAREIFIRQGLVAGEIDEAYARQWAFWRHNRQLMAEIETLEHKSRRPDVLVDDELIVAFYDQRIPAEICTGADFDRWRKTAEREQPDLLKLSRDDLMRHEAAGITTEAFPHQLELNGVRYGLAYHHEPGSPRDGVTLSLPLANLNQLPAARCEWLVPGLLREKVIQLVKTLPQRLRAKLVPVPEFADEFIAAVDAAGAKREPLMNRGLVPALVEHILATRALHARGWAVTPDAFRADALPPHFSMNFCVLDEHGRQLEMGRNLGELRARLGKAAKREFAAQHETPAAHAALTDWTFGELPELLEVQVGGQSVIGFPGLVEAPDGASVALQVFDAPEAAHAAHRAGLLRLFKLQFKEQLKYFEKNVPGLTAMAMQFMPLGAQDELRAQLIDLAFARACLGEPWPADAAAFRARVAEAKPRLGLMLQESARLVGLVLAEWAAIGKRLSALAKAQPAAVADLEAQVGRLVDKRFVTALPFERLQHLPRYLKAVSLRLDKLRNDPARDARLLADFAPLWANYERRRAEWARAGVQSAELEQYRWLLEELRVNLFAQELKTPVPVSVKRLTTMWAAMSRG